MTSKLSLRFDSNWQRLWNGYVKTRWHRLVLILFLVILVAGCTSAYPLAIQWIFERFEQRDVDALMIAPLIIIGVTLTKSILFYIQSATTNAFVIHILKHLQTHMFAVLMREDQFLFSKDPVGSYASRFTTDLIYIRDALLKMITGLLRDSFTVVALLGALIYIDWKLAIIALCVLPIAIVPVNYIGRRLRRVASDIQKQIAHMMAFITEALYGLRAIKAFNAEDMMTQKAFARFDHIEALQLKSINRRAMLEPILEVLGGLAVAGVIAVVAWRVSSGEGVLGTFTGFISALLLAAQSVRGLGNLHLHIQEGSAALERVFAIIDEEQHSSPKMIENNTVTNKITGTLSFKNIDFSYVQNAPILQQLSLDIKENTTTALIGRSGAGKSTLFSLLLRFVEPTHGEIQINDIPINKVSKRDLRDAIAYVGQDSIIFEGTIEDNIRFGNLDASFEAVEAAAKLAAADGFISQLPMGYQAYVGDRGANLSGGQKQRIALARALLKNAPILLLDEPTSALDAESEHAIHTALQQMKGQKTIIIIAHRLSTIQSVDSICVLDHGQLNEQGTHAELLEQQGLYAQLYQKQEFN